MEGLNLDVISGGQKIHFLFLLLPLLAFIFYKVNLWIILIYTIIIAIQSLYIYILIAFKSNSTQSVLYQKEKKLKEFWYIPYVWLFAITTVINIIAFVYTFYLSIIKLDVSNNYSFVLLLSFIFVLTFEMFMLVIMRYYRLLIPKLKKENTKNGKYR